MSETAQQARLATKRKSLLDTLKRDVFGCKDGLEEHKPNNATEISDSWYNFEKFPEYFEVKRIEDYFAAQSSGNMYFRSRNDTAADTITIDGKRVISYSSYNYLGLSGDPRVNSAVAEAVGRYGTSVSASRIVGGEIDLHRQLERELAATLGAEDCVVSVGGYITNTAVISYLCRRNDLVLHDALIHNSLMSGCLLSGARRIPFPHNDFEALERLLAENRRQHERVLIIVEGVYSMDGDIPDIARVVELKKRYKALLMVDEAHSIGVIGERGAGVTDYFGIAASDIDIIMGTMSKSLASCGGFIVGRSPLIGMLKYFAPGLVLYSAGITPANAAAALCALTIMRQEPERVERLRSNARYFLERAKAGGLDVGISRDTAIVPILLGNSDLALQLMTALCEDGIFVHAMLYPVVPMDLVRLRFFITAAHTQEQLGYTVDRLVHHINGRR